MTAPELLVVDVAHPPLPPDSVERILLESWSRARSSPAVRVLKIVHGYGSSGKGGATQAVVRNWAFRHRGRFRAVIEGESYGITDPATREMRLEVGAFPDLDLDSANRGVTILWVK